MKRIFVDTSAWDAIADKSDKNHVRALEYRDEIMGQYILITSNYVLDELYTLLLMNVGYQQTIRFKSRIDILISENVLKIYWVTNNIHDRAWQTFRKFNIDKQWSFTDCTSYTLMKDLAIARVFAFDHHFEQMGFNRNP
ncbi:MAG: PIN domain-containing protein [Desulfatirhabdiaceae bacterium]